MMLIEANKAYEVLTDYYHHKTEGQRKALREALSRVPTIEAEPVVRCKDCKSYRFYDGTFGKGWICFKTNNKRSADDFCSRGERREE